MRKWFPWLTRTYWIPYNPDADLDLLKIQERLPKNVLSVEEVERVLKMSDTARTPGIRDRAMLETCTA